VLSTEAEGQYDDLFIATPSTKLRPPSLPLAVLARPHLVKAINGWRQHCLTLVTAPAGYGKTTLATCAVQDAVHRAEGDSSLPPVRAFWLALDEHDDDPVRFVSALATAVAPVIPPAARAAIAYPLGRSDPAQALLRLLARLETQPETILIVLDDFHRIKRPEVRELLATALERSAENLHWMVLARHSTPVPVSQLRLRGQVLEFSVNDLRFSRAEIEEFLALAGVAHLDAEAVELLDARTHGWIAGLHLAKLSLQRRQAGVASGTEDARPAHDLQLLLSQMRGDNALLAEYLTSEVLGRVTEPLRSFLLDCAILERLNPSLCTAVSGIAESRALLRQAVAQQLFVRQLDAEGNWYEMHHLFRELLLDVLEHERGVVQIQMLHRRAADWYLAQGDIPATVRALLAGQTPNLAAELVQSRSRAAILHNQLVEARQWIALLPAAQVEARPQLLLDAAWLAYFTNVDELADAVQRAQVIFTSQPNLAVGWRDELAVLTVIMRFFKGPRKGLYHDAVAIARQCHESSTLARGWAWMFATLTIGQEAGANGLRHAEDAATAFAAAGMTRGHIHVLGWQAFHHGAAGAVNAMLQSCTQALHLLGQQPNIVSGDDLFFTSTAAEALYLQDRVDEAMVYLEQTLAGAQRYDDPLYLLQTLSQMDLCAIARGDRPASLHGIEARDEPLWERMAQGQALSSKAHIAVWQMRRGTALGIPEHTLYCLQKVGVSLETLADDAPNVVWLALLTACVATGQHLEQLTPKLEMVLQRSENDGMLNINIATRLLQAQQMHRLGRRNDARGHLRRALKDVEKSGHVRLVLDQPDLVPLLRMIDSDQARALLKRMERPGNRPAFQRLTAQQMAILRRMGSQENVEQIADALVLSTSTVQWHMSRIYSRLGVKNRADAVAAARRLNLL